MAELTWQIAAAVTSDGVEPTTMSSASATVTNATPTSASLLLPPDDNSAFQAIDRYVTPVWWSADRDARLVRAGNPRQPARLLRLDAAQDASLVRRLPRFAGAR